MVVADATEPSGIATLKIVKTPYGYTAFPAASSSQHGESSGESKVGSPIREF